MDPQKLKQKLLEFQKLEWGSGLNLSPSQMLPVVLNTNERVLLAHWGLIPLWAKEKSIGYKMINARGETLLDKSAYRGLVDSNRCLVPAHGFYEWKKEDKTKQPYLIQPQVEDEVLYFAGLWSTWISNDKEELLSFTIITTAPNKLVAPLHDRMPAILEEEEQRIWLSDAPLNKADLEDLLAPAREKSLKATALSKDLINPLQESALLPKEGLPVEGMHSLFDL